jgi:hypothetical protein
VRRLSISTMQKSKSSRGSQRNTFRSRPSTPKSTASDSNPTIRDLVEAGLYIDLGSAVIKVEQKGNLSIITEVRRGERTESKTVRLITAPVIKLTPNTYVSAKDGKIIYSKSADGYKPPTASAPAPVALPPVQVTHESVSRQNDYGRSANLSTNNRVAHMNNALASNMPTLVLSPKATCPDTVFQHVPKFVKASFNTERVPSPELAPWLARKGVIMGLFVPEDVRKFKEHQFNVLSVHAPSQYAIRNTKGDPEAMKMFEKQKAVLEESERAGLVSGSIDRPCKSLEDLANASSGSPQGDMKSKSVAAASEPGTAQNDDDDLEEFAPGGAPDAKANDMKLKEKK